MPSSVCRLYPRPTRWLCTRLRGGFIPFRMRPPNILGFALEVPGIVVGHFSLPPLPNGPVVTGRGTLVTDSTGLLTVSWAFPNAKRPCVIEEIILVTAPLQRATAEAVAHLPDRRRPAHVPDWTRRADKRIQQIGKREDERPGQFAGIVTVCLKD